MKDQNVKDIKERDFVDTTLLATRKTLAIAKNGKPYLMVTLQDNTGAIEGRVWDDAEHFFKRFEANSVVHVRGRANFYQGRPQLVMQSVETIPAEDVDLRDYLPSSKIDPETMLEEFLEIMSEVENPLLKELVKLFAEDEQFMKSFSLAPAAKAMHHVFIGGLLEHTLTSLRLAKQVIKLYEGLNADLVLLGLFFHDMGKTRELSYEHSFDYSDEGRLVGHINIGAIMLNEKIAMIPDFPVELKNHLLHIILSHHGLQEYGSPLVPQSLEAMVVHYIDDLDSKINSIQVHVDSAKREGTNWTEYHKLYERYFYTGPSTGDPADANPGGEEADYSVGRTAELFKKGKGG